VIGIYKSLWTIYVYVAVLDTRVVLDVKTREGQYLSANT